MLIFKEDIVLSGYTCIVPSLGVGNVSQLSTDLIISTLKLKQIASGFHEALIPMFGPSAFQHEPKASTHAMNAYIDKEKKLLVFQIRSPLVGKHTKDFLTKFVDFLKKSQIAKVVILGSCFSFEKHDMESSPFEFVSNEQFDKIAETKIDLVKNTNDEPVFGDGWGQRFLKICTASELPAVRFYKYSAEGDNTLDAAMLALEVNKFVPIFDSKGPNLVRPDSWKLLFGNDAIKSMY
ncbi:PSMG2 family protein [Megaselia abdita]